MMSALRRVPVTCSRVDRVGFWYSLGQRALLVGYAGVRGVSGSPIGYAQMLDELRRPDIRVRSFGDWGFMPTEPEKLRQALTERALSLRGAFVQYAYSPGMLMLRYSLRVRTARLLGAAGIWMILRYWCWRMPMQQIQFGPFMPVGHASNGALLLRMGRSGPRRNGGGSCGETGSWLTHGISSSLRGIR